MSGSTFKPLVVGAPRSGFALLSSIVIHFLPLVRHDIGRRQEVLNVLLRGLGDHVSNSIVDRFASDGITNDLLYNKNFRYPVGGSKWIPRDRQDDACFRKYIGVRGKGDFTLITRHPRAVLNLDEIVHSHADPKLWLEHPGYSGYTKFASVRNPAVEWDFLDYNIVRFDGRCYGLPRNAGPVDLMRLRSEGLLGHQLSSDSTEHLKAKIIARVR